MFVGNGGSLPCFFRYCCLLSCAGVAWRTRGCWWICWPINTKCSQIFRINNYSLCCPLCSSRYFKGFSSSGWGIWSVNWYFWTTLAINYLLNFSGSQVNSITCVLCLSQSFPLNYIFLSLLASVGATLLLEGGCWENSFHIKAVSDSESSHYQRDSFGHFTVPWASIKILGLG